MVSVLQHLALIANLAESYDFIGDRFLTHNVEPEALESFWYMAVEDAHNRISKTAIHVHLRFSLANLFTHWKIKCVSHIDNEMMVIKYATKESNCHEGFTVIPTGYVVDLSVSASEFDVDSMPLEGRIVHSEIGDE